ncbi:hypothetical protein Salmuc_02741 [Salipiger mucosus DSM 16094]|uniref:Uncharacterized protein n=2 Tax=Salipiger mucosus TaxID=263378 RepID=S9QVC5_9RHOB|nr:hypothetical protein Salmuc_02741 [Salipiger mucosus DSM 16094]
MDHIYSGESNRIGTAAITALQELDVLAQSTDALASYTERLSRRLPKEGA